MDYNHIESFLHKFKTILFQKEEIFVVIQGAIQTHAHITIPIKSITLNGSNIRIQASPMARSEVLLHKMKILEDINILTAPRHFTNIV